MKYCDEGDFKDVPFSNIEQSFYQMVNFGLYSVLSDDKNNNWFLTEEEYIDGLDLNGGLDVEEVEY